MYSNTVSNPIGRYNYAYANKMSLYLNTSNLAVQGSATWTCKLPITILYRVVQLSCYLTNFCIHNKQDNNQGFAQNGALVFDWYN
jgi:hypothetical protein